MTRAFRCVSHLALLSLIGSFALSTARAQAIDWLAESAGMSLERDAGSSRLAGMGGLTLTIPDEGRELNLSDYGRNLAGVLWDSDASRGDFWYRSDERVLDDRDASRTRTRNRAQVTEAGTFLTWRHTQKRVLGVEYAFEQLSTSIERGDRSQSNGPTWGGLVGQQFGRFVLSGAIRFLSDDQNLTTANVFGIRHQGTGVHYVGAIGYDRRAIQAAVQAERKVNTIDGVSREESRFHEDELTWKRPASVYSGVLVWSPLEAVRGAVRGQLERIDGRQEVKISWSDRMPDNPGRTNFSATTGAFDEKIRGSQAGTRWDVRPTDAVHLGLEGEIRQVDTDVTEGVNYKGSRRAEDATDRWTRLGGGIGYELLSGKARVGAEGWYGRHSREDRDVLGSVEVVARSAELRTGAEWFLSEAVALRAGFVRSAVDDDVDRGNTLRVGNGVTFGLGYLPRGGLYQLDAALRIQSLDPDYEGDPSLEESRTTLNVGARFLF